MTRVVRALDSAAEALAAANDYLEQDPIRHNLILTLLHARSERPEPGRYWIVTNGERVEGVVFQSPLHFHATITPMPLEATDAVIETIAGQDLELPGVSGEAASAARFAGQWTEATKAAARPVQGQRIYEIDTVIPPIGVEGASRVAGADDGELLVDWFVQFGVETGEKALEVAQLVDRRVRLGQLWLWDNDGSVAMAARTGPTAGVVRIGPVYTPPGYRSRGYASALVASMSRGVLAEGNRCILYTDLGNPTSNSVYRAIGYRAVAEALKYDFAPHR